MSKEGRTPSLPPDDDLFQSSDDDNGGNGEMKEKSKMSFTQLHRPIQTIQLAMEGRSKVQAERRMQPRRTCKGAKFNKGV